MRSSQGPVILTKLYFMWKLRQFVVDGDMRSLFYHSFDENSLLLCLVAWWCSLPAVKKSKLNQIVNMCSKAAVAMLNSLAKTGEVRLVQRAQNINEDMSLPNIRPNNCCHQVVQGCSGQTVWRLQVINPPPGLHFDEDTHLKFTNLFIYPFMPCRRGYICPGGLKGFGDCCWITYQMFHMAPVSFCKAKF